MNSRSSAMETRDRSAFDGTMTTTADDLILLAGGTGTTGRRIAQRLRDQPVRVAARSTTPRFDWHDSRTWDEVLDGVRAAYLAYAPDLAVPGAAETVGAFARRAAARGVGHLVLLSGRGEVNAQHAEQLVRAAGADWTILRCAAFAQNFSEGAFVPQVLAGALAMPVADVPEPFVDADDIADVAVAALTGRCERNRVYELTGPSPLTFGEALATIGGGDRASRRLRPGRPRRAGRGDGGRRPRTRGGGDARDAVRRDLRRPQRRRRRRRRARPRSTCARLHRVRAAGGERGVLGAGGVTGSCWAASVRAAGTAPPGTSVRAGGIKSLACGDGVARRAPRS
jgi:nucleoside-diphosphate-sugar epimerase